MHVSQTEIPARVAKCQPLVVQSQQVQHRRVEIRDHDFVFDGVIAEDADACALETGRQKCRSGQ